MCIRDSIEYLAKHGHWSPFTHATVSFRIKAPIFVARQLAKHQVGLSWNEVSRRYVDSEPEFYVPDSWRKRAENVKQGSSDKVVEFIREADGWSKDWPSTDVENCPIERHVRSSSSSDVSVHTAYKYTMVPLLHLYQEMIEAGVCPEQARMVLPQSMYTEWIWTGSLYAFARVCNLRLDSHTQRETQEIAKKIADHMKNLFPTSWRVLCTP